MAISLLMWAMLPIRLLFINRIFSWIDFDSTLKLIQWYIVKRLSNFEKDVQVVYHTKTVNASEKQRLCTSGVNVTKYKSTIMTKVNARYKGTQLPNLKGERRTQNVFLIHKKKLSLNSYSKYIFTCSSQDFFL